MVSAGEEEALTNWEVGETLLFFFREFEDVGKYVDGGSALFEEELHRGVGNDSATHLATHEVFNVLRDGGEAEVVFASALGKTEEEVSRVVVFHELPGLIDDEEAAFLLGADNIPDMAQDDIDGDRAKFVLEVANIEDDHLIININV